MKTKTSWNLARLIGEAVLAVWLVGTMSYADNYTLSNIQVDLDSGGVMYAMAHQADGKIIIGGDFHLVNNVACANIARLNQDGSVDATWQARAGERVNAVAVNENHVYAGGNGFLLQFNRINGDVENLISNPQLVVYALAVQGAQLYAAGTMDSRGNGIMPYGAKLNLDLSNVIVKTDLSPSEIDAIIKAVADAADFETDVTNNNKADLRDKTIANGAGLAAPTNVQASDGTYTNKVRITWDAVAGATKYRVYAGSDASANSLSYFAETTSTNYDDITRYSGVTNYYAIAAGAGNDSSEFGSMSAVDSGYKAAGLAAPTNVQASDGTYTDKIRVTWDAVVGATNYLVYASGAANALSATNTFYDDYSHYSGETNNYTVRALGAGRIDSYLSVSNSGYKGAGLATPTGVAASDGTYTDKVRVTWDAVVSATNYEVYSVAAGNSSGAGNTSSKIADTPNTSYDDAKSSSDVYNYTIRATGANHYDSLLSASASGHAQPISPPTGVSATDGTYSDKVRVTWDAVSGATSYEVWRGANNDSGANNDTTGASRIAQNVTATAYDDSTVGVNQTNYYWVKAANSAGTSSFSSYDTGYRAVPPDAPVNVAAGDGTYMDKVRVTWNGVSGAVSYQVWRHTANDSSAASQIGTPGATTYDDTTAMSGMTYYYWVKTVSSVGASEFSAPDTGYVAILSTTLAAPENMQASDGTFTDKVRVSWNASSGATSYLVWRNATNDSSSASLLTTTSSTTYDDTSATTAGLTLYYWVKAKNDSGVSAFSQPNAGYCGASGSAGIADLSLRGFLFLPAVTTSNAHPEMVMLMPVNNGPDNLASSGIGFDFFLSGNTVFGDGDDEWIGDYQTTVSINAGAFISVIVSDAGLNGITIPPTASGAYYVFAKVKHTSAILDPNMINNTAMRSGAIFVGAGAGAKEPVAGDFDGDNIADPCVYQESTGNWYMKLSRGGYGLVQVTGFGGQGWKPMSGDYDGDSLSDLAIYQESTGNWQIKLSASGYSELTTSLGGLGYASVSGDFDGGGHSDLAVYREANGYWLVILMETEAPIYFKFGQDGYVPVTGDYTGDGVTDLALYQESTGSWFLKLGDLVYELTGFGGDGWKPVGGDYDGDGLEDLILYQASTGNWMIRLSGSGYAVITVEGFGGSDCVPVSGDYDGDGMADLVLYNAVTATWRFLLSSAGYMEVTTTF